MTLHEAFDGLNYDEDHDKFIRVSRTGLLIRAQVDTESTTIEVGEYGERGGWRPLGIGGTIGQLRFQRSLLSEAIDFAQDLEIRRKLWIEQSGATT